MRSCALVREEGGQPVQAIWTLAEDAIVITSQGSPPTALPLKSVCGISGDGYRIELAYGDGKLALQRLGADGPSLLETMRRRWPSLRADALRLTGTGEPVSFSCRVSFGGEMRPCALVAYEEVLLVAPDGEDLRPLFLALASDVTLDEGSFTVVLTGWDSSRALFSKLAGQTEAFYERLQSDRAEVSRAGQELLAGQLPRLGAGAVSVLAGIWPPGRMAPLGDLQRANPDFDKAFGEWVARTLRHAEGKALLASASEVFAGYAKATDFLAEEDEGAEAGPESGTAPAGAPPAGESPQNQPLLWVLGRVRDEWLLEALSQGDHATYRFGGDAALPWLVSQLLCAPRFSREALYLPLSQLAGERAPLATPARELGFLAQLRALLKGRIIHSGIDRWMKEAGLEK